MAVAGLVDALFGGAIKTGTHGSCIKFVMPGILVVAAAFAAVTTTISVAADMLEGVHRLVQADRERLSPAEGPMPAAFDPRDEDCPAIRRRPWAAEGGGPGKR